MELIELDATAQRALELLTNAGMSDGSIYDYTHTGFGSILRHFHTKGILYATAEMLDNFLLEQRVLLDQGDISQWKWGLVRRSCELLKQCAAMNSIDLPDLQPWDPVWNRPKQIIQHDAPTAKQFAESENIYVLVWMVNKRMEQLGLSENTVRHYTEEGLAVILKKHYDSGTESYSDKLISQLTDERRLQYEQGEVGRTTYQNLRKAAAMLQEFRLTGKITLERIPNWGRREVIPQHKAILDKFSAHVTTQSNWAESSVSTVTSVARVFLLELEDHGVSSSSFRIGAGTASRSNSLTSESQFLQQGIRQASSRADTSCDAASNSPASASAVCNAVISRGISSRRLCVIWADRSTPAMPHSANSLPGMVRPVLSSVISFFMIDPPQVLKGRSGICTSRHIFPSLL